MGIHSVTVPKLLWITLLLIPSPGFAQTNTAGQFGCGQDQRAAFDQTDLKFVEIASPTAIKQWKTRPALVFEGFEAAKYGFTGAEFYRWHMPVPGREGFDQGATGDSADRLALAVRVVGPRGERWFELANPEDPTEGLLYIQQRFDNDSDGNPAETAQPADSASKPDEMEALLKFQAATPDAKLPLFSLSYWHKESGMYQVVTFTNHLLLDLRTGSPVISKTLSCSNFEPTSGACSAQDEANSGSDRVHCKWDASAADFRCTMTSPYGDSMAARTAQRDFYLLSGKPAKTFIEHAEFLPDLGQFALRIRLD